MTVKGMPSPSLLILDMWGRLLVFASTQVSLNSLALPSRPRSYLDCVIQQNEKTGSNDHDEYNESENLCRRWSLHS